MSKNWIPSKQIYGQPMGITDAACVNNMYVAHADPHPDGSNCFDTLIFSTDFEMWQHRTTSPVRDYKVENVKFFTDEDTVYAAGSKITETSRKLVIFQSQNGFDWFDFYETEEEFDGYTPIQVNYVSGLHIISCVGCIFVSNDKGKNWNKIRLPEEFKDAVVSGSAFNGFGIHLLLKKDNKSYIARMKEANAFDIRLTPWLMESVAMTSNQHQILVSGKIKNHSFVIFFIDDPEAYEILSIPEKPEDENFVSVFDMQWIDGEWYFACSKQHYNSSGLTVSNGGYMYRIEGDLTVDSILIKDNIVAKQLDRVCKMNDKIVTFGDAWPGKDGCFFVLECD